MQRLLRSLRQRFHPLFYLRKTRVARAAIRAFDAPVWLSMPSIRFQVRGRLITHGLAFAAIGSQEPNPEALALSCFEHLKLRSFWDVGAHIGYYTWLLKSAVPDLQAVLFEPFLPNVEFIRATAQHASLNGIEVIVAAVSDQTGTGTLKTSPLAGATSSLEVNEETFEEMHWGSGSGWQETLLTSIDETRSRHQPVDFIKIDVEGHEAAVLRGAARTIATDQPVLFIECSHPGKQCLVPLQQQGYCLVDADRLTMNPQPDSTNFFAFPQRLSRSVELILSNAVTLEKARNSRHGNGNSR